MISMDKVVVIGIIVLLLFVIGIAKPTEGAMVKQTRGEDIYALSFMSYRDLRNYFEDHDFVVPDYSNGVLGSASTIDMASLHYLYNHREYFVIIPCGLENKQTGSMGLIHKNLMLSFDNIPQNVTIIISGFSGGSISVNNFGGELILGGYVPLEFGNTAFYGINLGYAFSSSDVSGLEGETIAVNGADKVVITNYVADNSLRTPITLQNIRQVVFAGVSVSSWDTDPYGYGIMVSNVKNLTIENNAGVMVDENDNQYNSVFGLQVLGYERGLVMQNVGSFWDKGTTHLSGHPTEKMEAGIYAENVGNSTVEKGNLKYYEYNSNTELQRISMSFKVIYYYYNATEYNKTGVVINHTYKDRIDANYTSVGIFVNDWGYYRTYFHNGNVSVSNLTFKSGGETWGFDLLHGKDWSGNNTTASESYNSKFIIGYYRINSHLFHIFKDMNTGEFADASVLNLQKVFIHREVASTMENDSVENGTTNGSYVYIKSGNVVWCGSIWFEAEVHIKTMYATGLYMSHFIYGIAVPDNGTKEESIIEAVNSTAVTKDVNKIVGLNTNAQTKVNMHVGAIFVGGSSFVVVLIAFAFVRWMWAYLKTGGDTSPEELSHHKEMLRNIIIGAVIVVFVLYNFAWLMGLVTFP